MSREAKPTQTAPAEAELIGSEASSAALVFKQGRLSAGGSSRAPGLKPAPADPCPFGGNRHRGSVPSALSRAPLNREERKAGAQAQGSPSPHHLHPPPPSRAHAAMAPLDHFLTCRDSVFQEKSHPRAPGCLSAAPLPPPLKPSSSPTPHKMSPSLPARPGSSLPGASCRLRCHWERLWKRGIYLYPRWEAPCAALALCK